MASVFVIKEKVDAPMEWYSKAMKCSSEWTYDDKLEAYHLGSVYMNECDDSVSFEDMSEDAFFGWETSS